MDLVKTRAEMMASDDINQLYNIELDLTQYVGTLHKNVVTAGSNMEQVEEKAKLSMANALLGICRERQAEVKDTGNRLNYNFRMAAKSMLDEKTFDDIMQKARLPRRTVKEEFKNKSANQQ